jgi:formylglycine-generating enzyme required for sulfatase activity
LSVRILVRDASGTREVREADLPLAIGTGTRAAIRLPGPVADVTYALVGLLDGRAFLQPVAANPPVALNGAPVSGTRWLGDGDGVSIGSARIGVTAGEAALEFQVRFGGVDYATLPPEAPAEDREATAIPVTPAAPRALPAPRPGRWRAPLFSAALTLVAACAFWLFTSRAVLISTDPADATVEVAGAPELKVGGRYLLRPGRYAVTASAAGYAPATASLEVSDQQNQELRLGLTRLPGRVRVTTMPEVAADVSVDGQLAGRTPTGELTLQPGVRKLTIAAPRFLPFEAPLEVEGGGILQDFEARLLPGWAEVAVTSIPAGASVLVDGAPAGTTPARLELMAGSRTLTLEKDGFKTLTRTVTAVAGEPQELLDLKLASADGLVRILSEPSGATVTVAGRYRGVTPLETELAPGSSYSVALSKAGYEPVTREVDLSTSRGATVRVELVARIGNVRITSEPADAELLVDGKPAGKADQELALPARPHRIEVRKEGFAPYVAEVTPEPGLPKVLAVKLLRPEEAVVAATPRTASAAGGQELRLVQPGELRMGAPRREQGRRANETERDVRITRPFYIGTREVTNSQFRAFRPNHTSGAEKYQELAAGDHPVVMLSWQDAAAYLNWLSDQDKLPHAYVSVGGKLTPASPMTTGYRLPTEAEWEWAARYSGGAGVRKFPWGSAMPPPEGAGNFADVSAQGFVTSILPGYQDGYPVTAPVGRFAPSPLGLYDLGGNAAEWVQDFYTVPPAGGPVAVDPTGPADGQYHVIRGSGWRDGSISTLRFSARDFGDVGRLDVGFRIARSAEPEGN